MYYVGMARMHASRNIYILKASKLTEPEVLSLLLTCHPYIHPLSFHEMIFILVYTYTLQSIHMHI